MHDVIKNVILCTLGTRGDIGPFVALAATLRQAGARVAVLANRNWDAMVTATGAEFFAISPPDPSQSGRDDLAFFRDYTLPSYQKSFDYVARRVARGERPVLVARSQMLGMEVAAERFGLRQITVALQPSAIASCRRPSWPLGRLTMGRAATIGSRLLVPAIYRIGEWSSPYRRATTGFRRANAARPPRRTMPPRLPGDRIALLCPEWFAMPAPDWPRNLRCLGFPTDASDAVGDATEAVRFLTSGPPAIVATPGTGVSDVARFAALMRTVARTRGMRLLLVSPHLAQGGDGDDVMVRAFVPLRDVLPHAGLLVHHGGIGTVGTAVAAGCPQLVLAGRFDQPDNGVRVAQLGLGGAILRSDPPDDMVGEAVDRIRRSGYVGTQVAAAAAQVRPVDAVGALAAQIRAL